MDLQLSVFLLFILFTGGQSLRCYECTSLNGSCADQTVKTCPELSTCFSSTVRGDNNSVVKIKSCVPSNSCLFPSISTADISAFCCNTDLCNAKDAELSGDSSSIVPNVPNGKKCYYCVGYSCSNIMQCSGIEDRCFTGTGTFGGQSVVAKSCISKAVCDAATSNPNVASISCCEGDLCNGDQSNGAPSVSQSFLFLCCSLLSYFLLH